MKRLTPWALWMACSLATVSGPAAFVRAEQPATDAQPGVVRIQKATDAPATIIRGQGPEFDGPIIGSAPGYGQFTKGHHPKHDFVNRPGVYNNNFGFDDHRYAGGTGAYSAFKGGHHGDSSCDYSECDNGCPPGGHGHCRSPHIVGGGFGGHGFPHHRQTYSYDWPQNPVYPPPVLPAGFVQYPYYTLRGPTDFFMK
jgi:hypothetical protein